MVYVGVNRKCAFSESVRSERVAKRRKGGRTVCGCGVGLVRLGVCAGFVVWGERKGFARLCICRKGERVGAMGESVCCGRNVCVAFFLYKLFRFLLFPLND